MRKKNSEKKKDSKLRIKWKTWMTVVTVIAVVFLISGATVLGVYLSGGFNEKVVYPESIEFDYGNNRFVNNQLEVEEDFTLTITTPTNQVTRDTLTLSFAGDGIIESRDGKISNGSIEVPQTVTIGRPFTVHLLTKNLVDENGTPVLDLNGNYIDWIAGGISTLVAQSQNIQIPSISVRIAVDVPVYDTQTIIYNSLGEEVTQVVKNESFTVKTKFLPANSEYMYSDDLSSKAENEKRKKTSFYEAVSTENLTTVYDSKTEVHFVAKNVIDDGITINNYTFKNAISQLNYEAENEETTNGELYYNDALRYLSDNSSIAKLSRAVVSIGDESVGNFTVTKEGQNLSMKVEEPLKLYLNNYPYEALADYLGINIYSTSGRILDNLLPNIVLSFDYNGKDPTLGDDKILEISGGEVIDFEGTRYYKPFSEGINNFRYSYWNISAKEEGDVTVFISLLLNDDTTLFEQVAGTPFRRNVRLTIKKHEELPPVWLDQTREDVLLDYTVVEGVSTLAPKTIDLGNKVEVPSENIYKDYVFFAWFGNGQIEDYTEKANSILRNGYIRERSKIYETTSGRLTLFALDGTSITLYDTGEFSIYVATIRPELTDDGYYQIVELASGSKSVVVKKSLYTDSVEEFTLDVADFPSMGANEISINQGSESTFGISFIVGATSVPVFKDEFQKGFMTPKILDIAGNDITDYFNFNEGTLTTGDESENATLEYRVSAKPSVQLEQTSGVYLGYVALNYNNGENDITWEMPLGSDQRINVYKPQASLIELSDNEIKNALLGGGDIEVEQYLTSSGVFNTTIVVSLPNGNERRFSNVSDFVNAFVGVDGALIKITDQKSKTDTLTGQWNFVISGDETGAIELSSDGKSFTFKNTDSEDFVPVSLLLQSTDGNATVKGNNNQNLVINFKVNSTGITKIAYDNETLKTYNSILSAPTEETAKAVVSKYGAKGNGSEVITLKSLINFYCMDNSGNDMEYTRVSFKFNPQYYSSANLSDTQIVDLYGPDGMLTLYNGDNVLSFSGDYSAENIRSTLASAIISNIKINKNFASYHTVQLMVTDESGAVNTSFDLELRPNYVVTRENYTQYAGSNFRLANTVSNLNLDGIQDRIDTLFDPNATYYVVLDNIDGSYKLVKSTQAVVGAIGTYNPGSSTITFADFWDTEQKIFTVQFQPEGENTFALNHSITFTINRDLVVTDEKGVFFVLGQAMEISDFAKITRHDGSPINNLSVSYTFEDYLMMNGSRVVRKEDSDFFFDYNQTSLQTKLTISNGNTIFDEFNVTIKLYDTDDVYNFLASKFTIDTNNESMKGLSARSQIVNNGKEDVNYIVFPANVGASWNVANIDDYKLQPMMVDHDNNKLQNFYEVVNTRITFKMQNLHILLTGLNDNTRYIAVRLQANNVVLATMNIPVIISQIGFDSVVYENGEIADNRVLETALTRPETLIANGIYNEITAGQLSEILTQYDMSVYRKESENNGSGEAEVIWNGNIEKGGLYMLKDFTPSFETYLLDNNYDNYAGLVKTRQVTRENASLLLNHLNDNVSDAYIAFIFTINKSGSGNSQSFYYVLKVKPDVKVENSLYAYNGNVEYIKGQSDYNNEIDLEALFNNTTLNEGLKRFMVSKTLTMQSSYELELDVTTRSSIRFTFGEDEILRSYGVGTVTVDLNDYFKGALVDGAEIEITIIEGDATISYKGVKVFKTLKFTNKVTSVVVGEKTYTTQDGWKDTIALSFSDDGRKLIYRPLITNRITFTIERSYIGGGEDDLAVIGGVQTFTFILNDDEEILAVNFGNEESTDYVVEIKNGSISSYEMNINLIKKEMSGSTIGITIYDRLNISLISGGENVAGYTYDNSRESQGKFTLNLKNYINSDKKVVFAVYTAQGYLATLTFELKANVTYYPNESTTTLEGGKDYILNTQEFMKLTVPSKTEEGREEILTSGHFNITDVTISGTGKDFVKISGNNMEIADLISDKEVTITYTVTFTSLASEFGIEDLTFIFSQTYVLKQNVSAKTSVASSVETIAGQNHVIDTTSLYNMIIGESLRDDTKIKIEASSSSPAFGGITDNIISTNYIASSVMLELTLNVSISNDDKTWQNFALSYSFAVLPAVKFETNYPIPNSNGEMEFEYIENDSTFANILTNFLSNNAIFSDKARIEAFEAVTDNGKVSYQTTSSPITAENLSILVNSRTNATVLADGRIIGDNEQIPNGAEVKFSRGSTSGNDAVVELGITYKAVYITYKIKIISNSITLTPQSVTNYSLSGSYTAEGGNDTVSYEKIYIDKTSSNNIFAGERLVYAQLSDVMATYANEYYFVFRKVVGSEINGDQERDVYNYYASYPIYIASSDQSNTRYYDLGISFAGKEFVGAYEASLFEKRQISINGEERQLKIKEIIVSGNEQQVVESDITSEDKLPANLAYTLFKLDEEKPIVKLANRLQLIYGVDEQGEDILVDYEKYSYLGESLIKEFNLTKANTVLNEIRKEPVQITLSRNDGSGKSHNFSVNYYYMASIDVDVEEKATTLANTVPVEVNKEESSLNSLLGIKHPTTGRIISASDFTMGDRLTFNIIYSSVTTLRGENSSVDENYRDIVDSYYTKLKIDSFNRYVDDKGIAPTDGKNIYLYRSAISNSSDCVYDYSIMPFGAKNLGDYVLGEIVYSVGEFELKFYVVFHISPDYVVKFKGNVENSVTEADGAIISNFGDNLIETIAETKLDNGSIVYEDFILTGEKGVVSIIHDNSTGEKYEQAVRNFKLYMPLNTIVESRTYNKQDNIEQKIFYDNNTAVNANWEYNEETLSYDYKLAQVSPYTDVTFTKVKEVIFAEQYYMIEGVDPYYYTYRLYFKLAVTKGTPRILGSMSIVEDELFDFGVQYQQVTMNSAGKRQEDSKNIYTYNMNASSLRTPASTDGNVKLLNFTGIEAWEFDLDYTNEHVNAVLNLPSILDYNTDEKTENKQVYKPGATEIDNGEYEEGTGRTGHIEVLDGEEYFSYPSLDYISIDSVALYDPNTDTILSEVLTNGGEKGIASPREDANSSSWVFATNGADKFGRIVTETVGDETETEEPVTIESGNRVRGVYGMKEDGKTYNDNLWKMPRLKESSIFNGAPSVKLRLVVTLKYYDEKSGITEFCDCPVEITVVKKANVVSGDDRVVRDGQTFAVEDKLIIPETLEDDVRITKYLNDTLEVLVPANQTISVDIELTRPGREEPFTGRISLPESGIAASYARTSYVSISNVLGITVAQGDTLRITNVSNNSTEFYYITNSGENNAIVNNKILGSEIVDKHFTISQIFNDVVYVENASLLGSSASYGITKSYIALCQYTATEKDSEGNDVLIDNHEYAYQVNAPYVVTGYIYKLERNYNYEIGFEIETTFENGQWTKAELSNWETAYNLILGETKNGGGISNGQIDVDFKITRDNFNYFRFSSATAGVGETRVGKAIVNSDGSIQLDPSFTKDQYMKLVLELAVSGADRDITNDSDATYLRLDTLNLGVKS